jgi:hypothetical protein
MNSKINQGLNEWKVADQPATVKRKFLRKRTIGIRRNILSMENEREAPVINSLLARQGFL